MSKRKQEKRPKKKNRSATAADSHGTEHQEPAAQCERDRANQGNPGSIGPHDFPGCAAQCAAQGCRSLTTASSSRGAQAGAFALVAAGHSPADGRKTKIDIAARGAAARPRALGLFLCDPGRA